MTRTDWLKIAALALWLGVLLAFRAVYVEPGEWAEICAAAAPSLPCLPRAGLLWLQGHDLWGIAALALGLAAFMGAPLALAALAVGIAGIVDYNVSWGMLGACLGAWAWITGRPAAAARS